MINVSGGLRGEKGWSNPQVPPEPTYFWVEGGHVGSCSVKASLQAFIEMSLPGTAS